MRYISLFSGIEAATVAWEPLGWEPVCFAELDEFPSAVLAERFPDVPNVGDVTKVDWKKHRGKVDLVVGGSPCQSFSVAGKREGLQGESRLMFEYIRALREIRPRWFLWENVPGALSIDDGETFRQLLSEMDKLGYGLAWRVLDAQFFGVPQRRRRLFLVGHLGACPPVEVLVEPESLRGDLESSKEKREALAARAGRSPHSAGFKYHQVAGAGGIGAEPDQSTTLTADWHNPAVLGFAQPGIKQTTYVCECGEGCLNPEDPQSKRVFTPRSCAPTLSSGTSEGMNIQPLILCVTDTQPNTAVSDEVCGTSSAHSKKDPPVACIAYAIDRATTPKVSEEVCHTLRRGGDGGTNDIVATGCL